MPTGIFISKSFPVEYYDVRNVGIRWLNVLRKYEKLIKEDYYRTTETWRQHHPVFYSNVRYSGGNPRLTVYTDDIVYTEIDEGTDIRYSVMSRDFEPKTRARVLRSFPGKGGFAYNDFENPRPGIEPRYFSDTITKKYKDKIIAELRRATIEGVKTKRGKG